MDKQDIRSLMPTSTSPVLKKVLMLLGDLKSTPSGAIIHSHIEQMLTEMVADHRKAEDAYASFLGMLLEACIAQLPPDSPLHTHLRLVQMRLTPPLSISELGALNQCVEMVADELLTTGSFRNRDLAPALTPLLASFGGSAMPVAVENTEPRTRITPEEAPRPQTEQRVNAAYRAHLEEKREEMQKLHHDFVSQMGETMAENAAFSDLLAQTMNLLQQLENLEDWEVRRSELLQALERLSRGHHALADKFSSAQEYLGLIEDDNQQLSDELDRVRLLSLTDELTGLPNRRAFMRRLEDEVSRVQRHGAPLGLVLIDLDHFKKINDQRGHATGDAVLRNYADKILSIFRHHDQVARYGGEEFAVLLPNTNEEGVLRALAKVRKRVAEVEAQENMNDTPTPTFSAGVVEYRPGETPSRLIERADEAMYIAKRNGRDRVELHSKHFAAEMPQSSGA
jgi:diguanylate cyclase (GGDEF)-like protein